MTSRLVPFGGAVLLAPAAPVTRGERVGTPPSRAAAPAAIDAFLSSSVGLVAAAANTAGSPAPH